jgi:anti-sigma regulatory factor (Ser/Thr protein kinase)
LTSPAHHYERMVPADAECVGPLRRALRHFARANGASPELQARVALAFSEACRLLLGDSGSNVGVLIVQATLTERALVVRVADRGPGVRPPAVEADANFALPMIAQVCDQLTVEHRNEAPGMALTMTFVFSRSPLPGEIQRPPADTAPAHTATMARR